MGTDNDLFDKYNRIRNEQIERGKIVDRRLEIGAAFLMIFIVLLFFGLMLVCGGLINLIF